MKILNCIIILTVVVLDTDSVNGRTLPHNLPFPMTLGSPKASLITYEHAPNKKLQKELLKEATERAEQCYDVGIQTQTHEGKDGDKVAIETPLRGLAKTLKLMEDKMSHEVEKRGKNIPPNLQKIMNNETRKHFQVHSRKFFACPNAEAIAPCLCDSNTITINCTATGNFSLIKEIFRTVNFPDKSFVTFLMRGIGHNDAGETILWNNTFGSVTFQEILIENTQLREVQEDAFAGTEATLKIIQMQHNTRLEVFPFHQLHQFNQLLELLLGYGSIQDVPLLQNIAKLETIYLNFNQIQQLAPKTFSELPALMVLDLGYNKLQSIAADGMMFSSSAALVYLDENNLSVIDDHAFSGALPSLLDVSHNLLTALNVAVFKPILDNIIDMGYSTSVDVTENPLCCTDIEWVLSNPTYSDHIGLPEINCTNLPSRRQLETH